MTTALIVRDFGSERTHLAHVESETEAEAFGAAYRKPDPSTKALCGVKIRDGIIMADQRGRVRCQTCRTLRECEASQRSPSQIWVEGWLAAKDGRPSSDNPYKGAP